MNQPQTNEQFKNFAQLKPGIYMVRTGAGFRKALYRFNVPIEEYKNVEGPSTFPCLVSLYRTIEDNKEVVKCTSVHFNTLYDALEKMDGPGMAVHYQHLRETT